MKDAWFELMASLSEVIQKKKQTLISKNIFQSILAVFSILLLEVILGLLALPIYLFFDFKNFPSFFNQAGCSYALYRMRKRTSVSVAAPAVVMLVIYLTLTNFVFAAAVTWDGDAADGLWSSCTNWSGDACPGTGDIATFSSGSDAVAIDASISVSGIDINSGYSGTITQNAGVTVTVGTSHYDQAGGTFVGGDSAIDINGNLTQTGGTFIATTATITISGNFSPTGGTFNHNGGTIEMDGSAAAYFDLPGADGDTTPDLSISNFNINKSGGGYVYANSNDILAVTGTLQFLDGRIFDPGYTHAYTHLESQKCESISFNTAFNVGDAPFYITGGSGSFTIPNGQVLPGIALDASGCTMELTGPGTTRFDDDVVFSAGTVNVNTAIMDFDFSLTVSGATINGGIGTENFDNTVTMSSGSWDSDSGALTAANTFTVSGATVNMRDVGTADINNTFTLSSGTFDAPSGTMYMSNNFNVTGGTFNHNGGTIEMDGSAAAIVDLPGGDGDANIDLTVANFSINKSSSGYVYTNSNDILATTGTLQFLDGYIFNPGYTQAYTHFEAQGDLFQSSSFTGNSTESLYITGSANQTFSGSATSASGDLPPITINKTGGTLTLGDGGSNTSMRGSADFTYIDGDVIPASSTFYFVGTMNLDAEATSGTRMKFDTVHINSGTVTLTGDLEVESDMHVDGGILTTGGNDMWVGGDWYHPSGTFTHGSNTVTFDGGNQTINDAVTFNNFTKATTTAAYTLTLPASATVSIAGTMTLNGAAGNLLSLRSTIDATQAQIDPQGTRTISYLDVKDNNNVNATAVATDGFNITHSGNLTNWSFTSALQFTAGSSSGLESVTSVPIEISMTLAVGAVTVDYTVTSGTADNTDFTLANGTATIDSGNTTTSITLSVTADGIYEKNETVVITLSNASGATLSGNTKYTYTITDDDMPIVNLTTANTFTQTNWDGGQGTNTSTQFATSTGMTVSTTGQVALVGSVTANWYDSNWSYRRKITIDNTKVGGDLTDFPVLVTEANLSGGTFFSNAETDGSDIVFTSDDGTTKLSREVVSINTGSETLEAWVKVPSVTGSTDTDIYVYYGNTGGAETNDTDVWDSSFEFVQHMSEDPSGAQPTHQDSTVNDNDGTVSGSTSADDLVSATIGNGIQFDGSGDSINFGNDSGMNTTGDMSFSMWYRFDDTGSYQGLLVRGGYGYLAAIDSNDRMAWFRSGWQSGNTLVNGTTYHLAWVVDSGTLRYYVNGAAAGTDSSGTGADSPSNDTIMGTWAGGYWIKGIVDETRFSSAVRSAEWISTEYNNQNAPSTFYSVDAEEGSSTMAATGSLTSAIYDTATTTHQWGVVNYITDIGVTTTVKIRTATSSDMTGATAWGSCAAVTNGADISGNGCVTDGEQYMEYQVALNQINSTSSIFQEISIQYLATNTLSNVENDLGTVTITATLSSSTTDTVEVPFTVSGSATNPADHDLSSGSITISSGNLTGTQTFDVVGDSAFESDETVILSMGSPTSATAGTFTIATITIENDDSVNVPGAPTVTATTTTGLNLVVDENSNPASTEYQICQTTDTTSCEGSGYLQTDGTLTSSSSVFQTYANWGGVNGMDVTGLATNTAYQFLVQAQDGGSTTTLSIANTAVYTLAPQVSSITISDATVTNTYQILMSWADAGQNGTKIERDAGCDESYTTIYDNSSTSETTPTTTATNIIANTCYQFRISAYNGDGVINSASIPVSNQVTTPPAQPTGLNTLSVDTDQIIWQWDVVSSAATYNIYDNTNGGLLGNTASTQYLQTEDGNGAAIESSGTYSVIVRAVNANGTGIASSQASATADPSAPSNLGHSANTISSITWTWAGDVSSTFYARDANNVLDSSGGYITSTAWQQTSLSANTAYTMEVRAKNDADQNSSYVSIARYTSQNSPESMTFSDITANAITVTASGTFTNLGTGSSVLRFSNGVAAPNDVTSGDSWVNTGLSPNTEYTYGVAATNGDGDKTSTTTDAQYTLAAVPGQVVALVGSTIGSLDLTLDANSNPASTNVRIYETTIDMYVDNALFTLTGATTDFDSFTNWGTVTVTGLSPNTAYQFVAAARNDDLVETASSTVSTAVYTQANVPANFSATAVGPRELTVTWGSNSNPAGTQYYVEDAASASRNSSWTTAQSYTFSNLTPATTYNFKVKARNGNNVETDWLTASGVETNSSGGGARATAPELPAGSQMISNQSAQGDQQSSSQGDSSSGEQRQNAQSGYETHRGTSGSARSYGYRSRASEEEATIVIGEEEEQPGSVSYRVEEFFRRIFSRVLRVAFFIDDTYAANGATQEVTLRLKKGESKEADINGDRIMDVRVKYLGIEYGEPQYQFTYLTNSDEWGTAVSINGGAYEATSRIVVLFLNVSNASDVTISNSEDFSTESFVPYQPLIPWTLSEGEGEKHIYIRFKTPSGGTATAYDTITYVSNISEPDDETTEQVLTLRDDCLLRRGSAYKSSFMSDIYYITPTCTKRRFPSMRVFFSYFDSVDKINDTEVVFLESISPDAQSQMVLGPKHVLRSGSLIKTASNPNVYLLIGNKIHWVVSETVFTALKFSWQWIDTISDDIFVMYEFDDAITTSSIPDGTIVSYPNQTTTYQIVRDEINTSTQKKRSISHPNLVDQIGYEPGRVLEIDPTLSFGDGESIDLTPLVPDVVIPVEPQRFVTNLRHGSKGDAVRDLQQRLRELGFFTHPKNTGYYGNVTVKAVNAYRAARNLEQIGAVDLRMRTLLEGEL